MMVERGIVSRESALAELKAYGCIDKDATVGDNPNKLNTGAKDA